MNGSMVKKNQTSLKTGCGYNATRRTLFLSWFQTCQRVRPPVLISQLQGHLQDRRIIVLHFLQARLRHQHQHQVIMRLEKREDRIQKDISPVSVSTDVDDRTGQPVTDLVNQKKNP